LSPTSIATASTIWPPQPPRGVRSSSSPAEATGLLTPEHWPPPLPPIPPALPISTPTASTTLQSVASSPSTRRHRGRSSCFWAVGTGRSHPRHPPCSSPTSRLLPLLVSTAMRGSTYWPFLLPGRPRFSGGGTEPSNPGGRPRPRRPTLRFSLT